MAGNLDAEVDEPAPRFLLLEGHRISPPVIQRRCDLLDELVVLPRGDCLRPGLVDKSHVPPTVRLFCEVDVFVELGGVAERAVGRECLRGEAVPRAIADERLRGTVGEGDFQPDDQPAAVVGRIERPTGQAVVIGMRCQAIAACAEAPVTSIWQNGWAKG